MIASENQAIIDQKKYNKKRYDGKESAKFE